MSNGRLNQSNDLPQKSVRDPPPSLLKTLMSRGSAFGYQAAVPCDPKGEYTRLARRLGCEPTYIGPGMTTRLNPLDAPPRPRQRASLRS